MHITSVSYGFTKNLGNFQSSRVDVTVNLWEGESFDDALNLAVAAVNEALDLPIDEFHRDMLARERSRLENIQTGGKS